MNIRYDWSLSPTAVLPFPGQPPRFHLTLAAAILLPCWFSASLCLLPARPHLSSRTLP